MKKQVSLFSTLLLLLVMVGCAVTDFDRSVNFNSYRTFGWGNSEVDVSNPLYRGDLINKRIKARILFSCLMS